MDLEIPNTITGNFQTGCTGNKHLCLAAVLIFWLIIQIPKAYLDTTFRDKVNKFISFNIYLLIIIVKLHISY